MYAHTKIYSTIQKNVKKFKICSFMRSNIKIKWFCKKSNVDVVRYAELENVWARVHARSSSWGRSRQNRVLVRKARRGVKGRGWGWEKEWAEDKEKRKDPENEWERQGDTPFSTWRHDDYFVTRFFFLFLSLCLSAFPLTGHIYLFICPSIFRVGAIRAILPALFPSIIIHFFSCHFGTGTIWFPWRNCRDLMMTFMCAFFYI